jgi:hypothetical protein
MASVGIGSVETIMIVRMRDRLNPLRSILGCGTGPKTRADATNGWPVIADVPPAAHQSRAN